jgi:hypothetical protein
MENLKILETFKKDKKFLLILAGLAVVFFLIASLAWPLFPGRDLGTYLGYFRWMFEKETPIHSLMCYRTILSSSVLGFLAVAGRPAANIFLLFSYILCLFSFYYLGSFFSQKTGRFFSLLMLVNFSWLVFFHELSSDLLLGIGLVFWAVYFVRIAGSSSFWQYAFLGLATFSLALVRPVAQIFVLVFLAPFWLKGINKKSFYAAGVFLAVWLAAYFSYASYNQARYDCFTLSRGGKFTIPAYKIFIQDRVLAPENGPASQLLAAAVEKDLLDKPLYKDRNISLKTFFSAGDSSMFYDLGDLSNRTWGWASDYQIIRRSALEAIAKHPVKIAASSLKNLLGVFMQNYNFPVFAGSSGAAVADNSGQQTRFLPGPYVSWSVSGSAKTEAEIETSGWVSKIHEKVFNSFTGPDGNFLAEKTLSRLGWLFPPSFFFLAVSLLLLGRLKEFKVKIIAVIFALAFLAVVIPAAAITPSPQFRLPFDFIFILAGLIAFFGSPRIKLFFEKLLPWYREADVSGDGKIN